MPQQIHRIHLPLANAYLISGQRASDGLILVDTGAPNDPDRIIAAIKAHGFHAKDISLIFLTHAHGDHAGSAKILRARLEAPIAVHAGDVPMLRAGTVRGEGYGLQAVGWEAALFRPFIPYTFPALEPDIVIDETTDLTALGFDSGTQLLHTPGHSDGSVSLIFSDGGAIAGDIVRGGLFGGRLNPSHPFKPYFMPEPADYQALYASVARVLERGAQTWHVGHGGPLRATDVRAWLTKVKT